MAERLISTAELAALSDLHQAASQLLAARDFLSGNIRMIGNDPHEKAAETYLYKLGTFAALAIAPFPTAPRSPGASGETAAGPATLTGGGLITEEGLLDALEAYHRDAFGGQFHRDATSWASQLCAFILRHCEQPGEARESAK